MESQIQPFDRKFAALFTLYVSDAVCMPVHWYYNTDQLKKDYPQLSGYVKPLDTFVGSYMQLSEKTEDSKTGEIVGKVILHNKRHYWLKPDNHYHIGLQAGENTLEAHLTRLMTRYLTKSRNFDQQEFRQQYIQFMQTPGSHNDSYAATAHRMFFKNLVLGQKPENCPTSDSGTADQIDSICISVPDKLKEICDFFLQIYDFSIKINLKSHKKVIEAIKTIRNIDLVENQDNGDLKELTNTLKDPIVSCGIEVSFPALLFFTYKYADDPEKALLMNAMAGGENLARGILIGALLGAAYGLKGLPQWAKEGLLEKNRIEQEITDFLK